MKSWKGHKKEIEFQILFFFYYFFKDKIEKGFFASNRNEKTFCDLKIQVLVTYYNIQKLFAKICFCFFVL